MFQIVDQNHVCCIYVYCTYVDFQHFLQIFAVILMSSDVIQQAYLLCYHGYVTLQTCCQSETSFET